MFYLSQSCLLCENDDGELVARHEIKDVPQLNEHAKQELALALQIEEFRRKRESKRVRKSPSRPSQ